MTAPFRRAFLSGALAVPATAALPAPISADPVKDAAQALADAMQARFGGRWVAIVDTDQTAAFVLLRSWEGKEKVGRARVVMQKNGGAQ